MIKLKPGDKAPWFSFENQKGEVVTLDDLAGKKVVLYFYPRDNTPGCTSEACNLRDNYDDLIKNGYYVLGVSPDSAASHAKFRAKHNLPFELIADPELKIIKDYDVWGEKKMFGKTKMGLFRTTFIIDEEGVIEEVITKVKTKDHVSQFLKV